jgi:pimeloyl-ACP methyl ester carboxylesterase
LVASAAPELLYADIGMGQVSYQLRSEAAAHQSILDQCRARGDIAMVRMRQAAPVSMTQILSAADLRFWDDAMNGLGVGTTRDITSVIRRVFVPVWQCRAYTLREKIRIWQGIRWPREFLWEDFITTDLSTRVRERAIPLYFFAGLYDVTANHDLAAAFFDQISTPVKGLHTSENSAHSPLFEELALARDIPRTDVLTGKSVLADRRSKKWERS